MKKAVLNPLPAPTWNRLGVNQAEIGLPEIPAGGWGRGNTAAEISRSLTTVECPRFSAPSSGSGDLDPFLREQANFSLHLAADAHTKGTVTLQHTLDHACPHAISHVTLRARPGSSITVIEVIRGGVDGSVHGSLTEIQAGEDAHVTLIQLQMLSARANSYSAVAAEAGEGAQVRLYRAALGGSGVLGGSQCHLLGCRYDNGTSDGKCLQQRQVYVAGTWRCIEDEVVELAPVGIGNELFQRISCHTSTP